jgi:hypothetical protein
MNAGADLTILVPLWHRTTNIERVAASALGATRDAEVLFIASAADPELPTLLARVARALLASDGRVNLLTVPGPGGGRGDYATKINAGYRATARPIMFTGADDIVFRMDWYDEARPLLEQPIGVVGTVDLTNGRTARAEHSTHSLVARWYADTGACVDEDHVVYHAGYFHEYCDDELVRTAMSRGAYAHSSAIVEHLHPWGKKAPDDFTYQRGRSRSTDSRRLYRARRQLWGDAPARSRTQYARRASR